VLDLKEKGTENVKVSLVRSGIFDVLYGTISDCEWDEKDSMATFFFAISEDEQLITVRCSAGSWLVLDIYNFALRLFHKASGALFRLPLVTDKHRQLTECITGFGNQKWDAEHNLKKLLK
jgi:hypothetical protein